MQVSAQSGPRNQKYQNNRMNQKAPRKTRGAFCVYSFRKLPAVLI
jgi:hypothetical protein